jgi:hypothetical protein
MGKEILSSLPYSTATSGDKAMAEIQRILQRFGCNKFGTMTDWDAGVLMVQFEWHGAQVSFPANFKGYATAWLKENPWTSRKSISQKEWEAKALEIGSIAVYSILRDWIKAQVTAVETGLISFEEVFMAHIMLPNGKRMIEHAKDAKLLEVSE